MVQCCLQTKAAQKYLRASRMRMRQKAAKTHKVNPASSWSNIRIRRHESEFLAPRKIVTPTLDLSATLSELSQRRTLKVVNPKIIRTQNRRRKAKMWRI